jgi:hypothetical protein
VNTSALPAFIQLISITLGIHFEENNQDRDSMESGFDAIQSQNNQGRHAPQYRTADFLKRVNWVQILTDLAMLLSTRVQNLDQPSSDKITLQVHMKFADWEACIYALEVLVATSDNYRSGHDQMSKRSKETKEALLTLADMAGNLDIFTDKFSCFGKCYCLVLLRP